MAPNQPHQRPQNYQRPQQTQHQNPTVAPGTPATQPAPPSEPEKTEPEIQDDQVDTGTMVRDLTFAEAFTYRLASIVGEIHIGTKTPIEGKRELQEWWQSLSEHDRTTYRYDCIEIGKQLMRQSEEIVNELPVLFM